MMKNSRGFIPIFILFILLFFSFLFVSNVYAAEYGGALVCHYDSSCYPVNYMLDGVEWQYNVNLSGYISKVTVAVYGSPTEQNDPNIDDYILYVNGYNLGNADSKYYNTSCADDQVFLVWDDFTVNPQLDNEFVLFELYAVTKLNNRCYDRGNGDRDGDGDTNFAISYHVGVSSDYSNLNGVYDGDTAYTAYGKEPIYSFVLSGTNPGVYSDSVYISPSSVYVHQSVFISASTSNPLINNYVTVSKGGVNIINESVPSSGIYSNYFDWTNTSGTYAVNLWREGSSVASGYFTVLPRNFYHYVKLKPNPCNPFDTVSMEVLYNYSLYDGYVFNSVIGGFVVPRGNVSSFFTFSAPTTGNYIFQLYNYNNGTIGNPIDYKTLYVGSSFVGQVYLNARWNIATDCIDLEWNCPFNDPYINFLLFYNNGTSAITTYTTSVKSHYWSGSGVNDFDCYLEDKLHGVGVYKIEMYVPSQQGAIAIFNLSGLNRESGYVPDTELSSDSDFSMVFAFIACLCIGLLAGVVSNSGLGFVAGFFGSIVFMSIPGHPFSFFPTVLLYVFGIGLTIYFVLIVRR